MPRKWYVGVENKARKVITPYIGVNGKARRVIKAYVGVNGVARYYYKRINVPALNITYTGEWEDKLDVVMGGKTYRLLTLKTSGTLTIPETVACDIWMVGGGNGGYLGSYGFGGGGGYSLFEKDITVKENISVPVVIGSAGIGGYIYTDEDGNETVVEPTIGGYSSFGQYKTKVGDKGYAQNGGSGGGAYGSRSNILGGTGDGFSKYPFEDNSYFEHPHGAGGGGGGYGNIAGNTNYIVKGGIGGSNGSYGGKTEKSGDAIGGIGGNYGGGRGGKGWNTGDIDGTDAIYYGAGGGGGGYYHFRIVGPGGSGGGTSTMDGVGGNGYQGVVYVRISYKQ